MMDNRDFKSLQDSIQVALVVTTRSCGQISSEDLGFQKSLNQDIGPAIDEQSQRLLALSNALLKSAASISDLGNPKLQDVDDVENNWRSVVDVVDSLLEKTDICLDEYTGVIKRKDSPTVESAASKPKKQHFALGNAFRTQNLVKPQLAFKVKADNNNQSPWKPLLTMKPHAIVPLEASLELSTNDSGQAQYQHPYETEIQQLKYTDAVYQKSDPIPYLPVEITSAIFVDTEEGVLEMLNELRSASEIAVDLEHHDTRSYVGLVSLMQISTRNKDWIIDTLKPWRQELQMLNEVFADPNIVKVFHGAYMDIVWLQRDLGLYVVGLFDTHYASRSLGYPGGSLAYLLKRFIDFDADKKYQMADWRIRPLPDEMFFYARADTHFLLYIFDKMRNELVERSNPDIPDENRIEHVLQKSKETSLLRYERQVYNAETGKGPGGWYSLLAKSPTLFNSEQFSVYRAIHEWRDKVARTNDDSINYVMPNHVVMSIAKLMPMDMVALLGIAHPVSHNVKSRTGELLEVIKAAKARGKYGRSLVDVLRPSQSRPASDVSTIPVAPDAVLSTLVAVVDETPLDRGDSRFWGGAFGSSRWDESTSVEVDNGLMLAIPLPQLSTEVFVTSSGLLDRTTQTTEVPSPTVEAKKRRHADDEPFVIKQGAKRNKEEISEADHEIAKESILLDETEEQAEKKAKAARKADRKAEKKMRKAERKAAEAEAEGNSNLSAEVDDDEEPFDYSKAESVLHGKLQDGERGKSKGKQPFNPYAKSANAPKGMKRSQTERAGKSHTFKN